MPHDVSIDHAIVPYVRIMFFKLDISSLEIMTESYFFHIYIYIDRKSHIDLIKTIASNALFPSLAGTSPPMILTV